MSFSSSYLSGKINDKFSASYGMADSGRGPRKSDKGSGSGAGKGKYDGSGKGSGKGSDDGSGKGSGSGSGKGSGSGSGKGSDGGSGSGSGKGSDDGSGSGSGKGSDDGSGKGSGSGSGKGSDDGSGKGSGSGSGKGSDDGSGKGSGSGSGKGSDDGSGKGSGSGSGKGSGSGSGKGSGSGSGHDDEATGTISGTVFCDTDCNGINGKIEAGAGMGSGSGSGSGSGKGSGSGSGKGSGSGSGSGSGKGSDDGSGKGSGKGSGSGSGHDDDHGTVYTPEPGKAGVLINLLTTSGTIVATTTTDAHGNYEFKNVPVGDYKIMGVAPDGTEFTIKDAGTDDRIDSDVGEDGTSDVIHVTKGSKIDIDLGVCEKPDECIPVLENTKPVVDLNLTVMCPTEGPKDIGLEICAERERLKDEGVELEKPIQLTLTLGDTLSTQPSSVQPDGKSSVSAIFAAEDGDGQLFVRVTDDSDPADTATVYFSGAIGFGESFTALASNAGEDKFSSNTYVHIFDDDGTLLQTIQYHTSCSAPILIGDQVGSVSVTGVGLRDKGTGNVVTFGGTGTTMETLGEGDIVYSISGGADAAFFTIDPETGELSFKAAPDFETPLDQGADNFYDVIVRATAKKDPSCFTEKPIEVCVKDVVELGALSGTYFCDDNRNGVEDAGDTPLAGKAVTLLLNGAVVATTTTDANGNYRFGDLAAGSYVVMFEDPAADGKAFIAPNVGTDDTIDSDVVDAANGKTDPVTVVEGQETTDVDAGVELVDTGTAVIKGRIFCDENDNSVDDGEPGVAGVLVTLSNGATTVTAADGSYAFTGLMAGTYTVTFPTSVDGKVLVDSNVGGDDTIDSDADQVTGSTGPITVGIGETSSDNDAGVEDPGTAVIKGRIFCDENDNSVDDGEPGVAGVLVTLSNGATTVTAADGSYAFTGLMAGTYTVTFPTSVDGKVLVDSNVGGDDTIDSDADQVTGSTGPITVGIGETSSDNDAGVEDPGTAVIKGRIFCDENDNSVDDGEPGVAGVLVTLSNGATTVTAADGSYAFTGLMAGTYTVTFPTSVDGKVLVDSNVGGDDTIDSDADQVTGSTRPITVGIGETSSDNDAGVEDLNNPPNAQPDTLKLCADEVMSVNVLANDTDPDGDLLTVDEFIYLGADGAIGGGDDVVIPGDGSTIVLATGAAVSFDGFEFTYDVTGLDSFDNALGLGAEFVEKFAYMVSDGKGGTSMTTTDVTVCGTASIQTVSALLSGATVTFSLQSVSFNNFEDAYTLNLLSSDNGSIPTGVFELAYCLDSSQDINFTTVTTANVFVLTEANAATVAPTINTDNIDLVNWLLNNDQTLVDNGDGTGDTYTDLEVQEAIWTLMNGDVFFINKFPQVQDDQDGVREPGEQATLENVAEIIASAQANGEGFVPGDGDVFGLILDPTDPESQDQPFIIGVEYECLC